MSNSIINITGVYKKMLMLNEVLKSNSINQNNMCFFLKILMLNEVYE